MRYGALLAILLSETVVGRRRRFLSGPTSLRPRLAPGPPCSLARSPKAGGRALRRTWRRTPWLGSHKPAEAESRSEALPHGTERPEEEPRASLRDRCIPSRELLPMLLILPACASAGQ